MHQSRVAMAKAGIGARVLLGWPPFHPADCLFWALDWNPPKKACGNLPTNLSPRKIYCAEKLSGLSFQITKCYKNKNKNTKCYKSEFSIILKLGSLSFKTLLF